MELYLNFEGNNGGDYIRISDGGQVKTKGYPDDLLQVEIGSSCVMIFRGKIPAQAITGLFSAMMHQFNFDLGRALRHLLPWSDEVKEKIIAQIVDERVMEKDEPEEDDLGLSLGEPEEEDLSFTLAVPIDPDQTQKRFLYPFIQRAGKERVREGFLQSPLISPGEKEGTVDVKEFHLPPADEEELAKIFDEEGTGHGCPHLRCWVTFPAYVCSACHYGRNGWLCRCGWHNNPNDPYMGDGPVEDIPQCEACGTQKDHQMSPGEQTALRMKISPDEKSLEKDLHLIFARMWKPDSSIPRIKICKQCGTRYLQGAMCPKCFGRD